MGAHSGIEERIEENMHEENHFTIFVNGSGAGAKERFVGYIYEGSKFPMLYEWEYEKIFVGKEYTVRLAVDSYPFAILPGTALLKIATVFVELYKTAKYETYKPYFFDMQSGEFVISNSGVSKE